MDIPHLSFAYHTNTILILASYRTILWKSRTRQRSGLHLSSLPHREYGGLHLLDHMVYARKGDDFPRKVRTLLPLLVESCFTHNLSAHKSGPMLSNISQNHQKRLFGSSGVLEPLRTFHSILPVEGWPLHVPILESNEPNFLGNLLGFLLVLRACTLPNWSILVGTTSPKQIAKIY